jgi:subtilase family serine protease
MTAQHRVFIRSVTVAWAVLSIAAALAKAQPVRITEPLDVSNRKTLAGNRNPRARAEDDQGPLNPFARISGMTLIFKPSQVQSGALDELLREQQDPSSPNYRNWLTPEQYASHFGLNPDDVEKVIAWLETEGLSVDYVARSHTWMMFSGTAGQVQQAFQTELRRFSLGGELHYANAGDPSIPAAIDPVVLQIRGLDDFRTKPARTISAPVANFTLSGGGHSLVPGDIATIYDIARLYQSGITGAGQKIAVVGQTDINLSDIEHFRANYGLPVNNPELVLAAGSPDPGVSPDDLIESSLDLEYAGGVAPLAKVLFVYSTDVWTSVEYAVDQDIAPIISTSYGYCEPQNSTSAASEAAYFESLAKQANLMGITWLAASGDTGAADCDLTSEQLAKLGLAVDLPASVPEVTGVGGTEFLEGDGVYWASTNNSNSSSAVSYIPETAWNDAAEMGTLLSTGGGASILFAKPVWQTAAGVPDDSARDVPDISLAGAVAHDPYNVYVNGEALCVGGTSAPTPVFSAILALLNQYEVMLDSHAKPGLGNINPTLYRLSQSTPEIFHDVVSGSNIVPCANVSPNCSRGELGYPAGIGYDQATGLGSVDAYNLVTLWNGRPKGRNSAYPSHEPHHPE